jgi:uncharacterized cupin superfamily protein
MSTKEARVENTPEGLKPAEEGWFVLNARECRWWGHDKFGAVADLQGDQRFKQVGVNLRVLQPGQPNCYYHRESEQEDFLVLAGECLVVIEGQERPLKAWDFVHCPPGTTHVFVGAGSEPCLILMLGAREVNPTIVYPVEAVALRLGAGVEVETDTPQKAYAGLKPRTVLPQPPAAALELMQG